MLYLLNFKLAGNELFGNMFKKLTYNGYFLFPFDSLATRTATNQAVIRILQQIHDI
jgi:hypothetical protein